MDSNLKKLLIFIGFIFASLIVLALIIFFVLKIATRSFAKISPVTEATDTIEVNEVSAPNFEYTATVNLTGEVDEIIGSRAFVVKNTGLFEQRMLVIAREDIAPVGAKSVEDYLLKVGDKVLIRGRVEKYESEKMESTTDVQIKNDSLAGWEGKPVIIASDLTKVK